jgi:hypothetical protein
MSGPPKMTPCERDTWLLIARLIREGRKKLEKQRKLNVRVDDAQLLMLAEFADRAQAIALGEEQPDLFERGGSPRGKP